MRTKEWDGASLASFLRIATPYYEAPGGIKVRLLRNMTDRARFIEVIEYAHADEYRKDQERTKTDPRMIALLTRWRSLLSGGVEVEVYEDVTGQIHSED